MMKQIIPITTLLLHYTSLLRSFYYHLLIIINLELVLDIIRMCSSVKKIGCLVAC